MKTVAATVESAQKAMSEFLTAEEIFGFDDLAPITVAVPAWGGKKIRLRRLTAEESIELETMLGTPEGKNFALKIVMFTAIDGEGNRLFPDMAMMQKLQKKSLEAIRLLQHAALDHNRLGDEAKKG